MKELSDSLKAKIEGIQDHIQEFRNEGRTFFASSSFQTHSLPMLHILGKTAPEMPVYFIQTGFHFPDTLKFRDQVGKAFGLNILNIESHVPKVQQRDAKGKFFFTSDPDYCCFLNKTQPMQPLLERFDIWVNGVRADKMPTVRN